MNKKAFITTILLAFFALANINARGASVYNILDYGAVGDGKTDDAAAIQQAIDECSKAGGGDVVVPAGRTFMCGPVHLRSFVNIYLEPNSRLLANPDETIYRESAFKANEGEGMMWLSGKDLQQVSITGTGCLDGNGIAFMGAELGDSYELKPVTTFDPRPHLLTLINVERIVIRDVTIRNSAYWTVHLVGCHDATIDGVSILNSLKVRNSDGIDVDHSRAIRISNCLIESGDDCICLKNRREYAEYGPCKDVTVTGCVMASRSCAIKIGSENVDSISRVVVTSCVIRDSNRGIGIQNRDEGTVSDVLFSDIILDCHLWSDVWWGKAEPIYVTAYPRATGNHKDAGWRFPKGATEGKAGKVSDIHFCRIISTSENGIFIGGDTPDKVSGITLDDVTLTLAKRTQYEGGVYDKRPCVGDGFIGGGTWPVYIDTASDISINRLHVKWGNPRPPKAMEETVRQVNATGVVID